MDRDAHWNAVYSPKGEQEVSWFEACSGLPVQRYAPETLLQQLGPAFELVESHVHTHETPWGATQAFQYPRIRRAR